MNEILRQRRYNQLKEAVDRKNERERIESDLRNMSDKDLTELINNTTDLTILALAEDEYVNRNTEDVENDEVYEDDVIREIFRTWQPS